ncbi:DUF2529 family protein [Bacillus suaedaesalsae]|uniref:DUF2529 domain-containing protein n=1 Tax=Bacillus suaedaesalsae TaxID=2810349 RepID=A0ABS2DE81_9BACI|nr:DUF2529 family protein [Bacillus suaedaesalsae]MBM6616776.1 DUF2529 domain-containing protein [Bacillus suaedaesalsae]
MLKIFATQLQGIFKKIEEKEEENLEDGARLLSQAIIGDGTVYIHGFDELKAVELTALEGPEVFPKALPLYNDGVLADVTSLDRVLLITRTSADTSAVELAKVLSEKGISVVAVSNKGDDGRLPSIVDVHIDSYVTKGLIPDETGNRYGVPTTIGALYAYYGLYFTVKEFLEENE